MANGIKITGHRIVYKSVQSLACLEVINCLCDRSLACLEVANFLKLQLEIKRQESSHSTFCIDSTIQENP